MLLQIRVGLDDGVKQLLRDLHLRALPLLLNLDQFQDDLLVVLLLRCELRVLPVSHLKYRLVLLLQHRGCQVAAVNLQAVHG